MTLEQEQQLTKVVADVLNRYVDPRQISMAQVYATYRDWMEKVMSAAQISVMMKEFQS